jgi:hypothetical protein
MVWTDDVKEAPSGGHRSGIGLIPFMSPAYFKGWKLIFFMSEKPAAALFIPP